MQPYMGLGNSLQTAQGGAGGGGGGAVGGWTELARTTLGSSGSTIDVTSIPDKRYYMVLRNILTAGADVREQFNSDTGSNYARRYSANGGTDVTSVSDPRIGLNYSAGDKLIVDYISNLSSKEKLVSSFSSEEGTAGAGNAPNRMEVVGKWANTSNPINEISTALSGSSYDIGSEVVVLGWDPEDTHTSNFWEELDDSSWSTGGSWTSGTFTAKKYLWVQFYTKGGAGSSYFRFNGDTGTNYANRYSINGGTDSTITGQPESYLGAIDGLSFHNLLIINNASNEKLFTHNRVSRSTAGAGTAPTRNEGAGKWANTSDQITSITVTTAGGGNFTAGNMKVWGSN